MVSVVISFIHDSLALIKHYDILSLKHLRPNTKVKPLNEPCSYISATQAEVAQHGQRRRTEAPIPQGFVGSNPTLRTNLPIRVVFEVIMTK